MAEIKSLKETVSTQASKIECLEAESKQLKVEVSGLKAENKDLKTENSMLSAKLVLESKRLDYQVVETSELRSKVCAVEEDNATIKLENTQLSEQLKRSKAQLADSEMNRTNVQLTLTVHALKVDVKCLQCAANWGP